MIEDITLDKLTYKDFRENQNSVFEVVLQSDSKVELKLSEVSEKSVSANYERFSLIFHGPSEHFLHQAIYKFEHSNMGEFEMFIVPVGRSQNGLHYEAVFNRLIKNEQGGDK